MPNQSERLKELVKREKKFRKELTRRLGKVKARNNDQNKKPTDEGQ